MSLDLVVSPRDDGAVFAGYSCPCGCHPRVTYERGGSEIVYACCCGNHFAVGPEASTRLALVPGDRRELQQFASPWGEQLQAAWALLDDAAHGHDHGHDHAGTHEDGGEVAGGGTDPVCGMTIDPAGAREKGLHSRHRETDYFFCGKGCKLDFDEDPERYLDPSYVPSM